MFDIDKLLCIISCKALIIDKAKLNHLINGVLCGFFAFSSFELVEKLFPCVVAKAEKIQCLLLCAAMLRFNHKAVELLVTDFDSLADSLLLKGSGVECKRRLAVYI